MIKRIIIVGSGIHIKKTTETEFIRIRKNQKFEFKKTDLIIIFDVEREINKGNICLFTEEDVIFNGFLKSVDSKIANKEKIPLLFSFLDLY